MSETLAYPDVTTSLLEEIVRRYRRAGLAAEDRAVRLTGPRRGAAVPNVFVTTVLREGTVIYERPSDLSRGWVRKGDSAPHEGAEWR